VGSMATVWHQENSSALNGIINPPRTGQIRSWIYENITLKQGDEMGRFLLGSTVVMLFEKNTLQFNSTWQSARAIKLGEMMGVK
jgi:phosphatidylserine decarboxylase